MSGSMIAVDDVLVVVDVGSLRRVDSRLMNDVLCLKRWYDDDVLSASRTHTHVVSELERLTTELR